MSIMTALLGEADLLAGQIMCPRSPPDALATFADQIVPQEEWVLKGVCAYVPQVRFCNWIYDTSWTIITGQAAWLRNASIKGRHNQYRSYHKVLEHPLDNILFSLPYDEERYQKTLEVSSLAVFLTYSSSNTSFFEFSRCVRWEATWRFWRVSLWRCEKI